MEGIVFMISKICSLKDYSKKLVTFKEYCEEAYVSRSDVTRKQKTALKASFNYLYHETPHINVYPATEMVLKLIDFRKLMVGTSLFEKTLGVDTLDLTNCDFKSLVNADKMFSKSEVHHILFDKLADYRDLRSVTEMFMDCTELEELDLSMFDFTYVFSYKNMITNCKSLKRIIVRDEDEIKNFEEITKSSKGYNKKLQVVAKEKSYEEVSVG